MNKQDLLKFKIIDVSVIDDMEDDKENSFTVTVWFETSAEATEFCAFMADNHPAIAIKKPDKGYEFVFKFGDYDHVLVFTTHKTPETYPPFRLFLDTADKRKVFLAGGIKLGGGNFMTFGKALVSSPVS